MDPVGISGIVFVILAFVYSFLRKAPLSLALAISFLVVYALLAVTSALWGDPTLSPGYRDMVLYHSGSMSTREFPLFFTSMFVHQNLIHLALNTAALILIGTPLEERIGTPAFALIFVVGGLAGTLTFYVIHFTQAFVLLGASGAISAELGAYGRLYPRERVSFFSPLFPIPPIPVIWVVIAYMLFSSVLVYVTQGIAHEAHIGGLIAGLAIAPLAVRLPARRKADRKPVDVDILAGLATTAELRDILSRIKTENLADVRDAWVGRFIKRARCPRCGGPIRTSLGRITSDCGWRMRLR